MEVGGCVVNSSESSNCRHHAGMFQERVERGITPRKVSFLPLESIFPEDARRWAWATGSTAGLKLLGQRHHLVAGRDTGLDGDRCVARVE